MKHCILFALSFAKNTEEWDSLIADDIIASSPPSLGRPKHVRYDIPYPSLKVLSREEVDDYFAQNPMPIDISEFEELLK